jgi:hypothetical protein
MPWCHSGWIAGGGEVTGEALRYSDFPPKPERNRSFAQLGAVSIKKFQGVMPEERIRSSSRAGVFYFH